MAEIERKLSGFTATSLIVTSMVGTGIFTSTGYQVKDLESIGAILFAWVLGGLTALCGALTYAELITLIPKNGGEYQLLSRLYHPAIGFLMGWVSLTVGFGAPIAAVAFAFGQYCNALLPGVPPRETGILLIIILSALHGSNADRGTHFQNYFTALKIVLILAMIILGLIYSDTSLLFVETQKPALGAIFSSEFSIGLIYVAFAYSGWNAAAYIAGEIEDPNRTLPRAFFWGTLAVTVLYVLMNIVFLSAAPMSALSGKIEIGHVVAVHLFGETAGRALSGVIALGLLSTVGAMILSGARVLEAMGRDYKALGFLAHRTAGHAPWRAVLLQSSIAVILLCVAGFDSLIEYTGFTVTAGLSISVFAIFIVRKRNLSKPGAYRAWGYPWTSIVYFILSLWMLIGMLIARPMVSLAGGLTLVLGLGLYGLVQRANP